MSWYIYGLFESINKNNENLKIILRKEINFFSYLKYYRKKDLSGFIPIDDFVDEKFSVDGLSYKIKSLWLE